MLYNFLAMVRNLVTSGRESYPEILDYASTNTLAYYGIKIFLWYRPHGEIIGTLT
jgi:hypothetical protein